MPFPDWLVDLIRPPIPLTLRFGIGTASYITTSSHTLCLRTKSVDLWSKNIILLGLCALFLPFLQAQCPRTCPVERSRGPTYRSFSNIKDRPGTEVCHLVRNDPGGRFATDYIFSCLCSDCVVTCRELSPSRAVLPAGLELHHGYFPSLVLMANNCTSSNGSVGSRNCDVPEPVGSKMSLQEDVRSLTMNTNCISEFSRHYFCNLSRLEELDLSCNALRDSALLGFDTNCSLASNSTAYFASQSHSCCACNLRHLNLRRNRLTKIKRGAFCAFAELTSLDLSGNKLDGVDHGALDGLGNLKSLDLSRNLLKQLPDDLFDSVPRLSILSLSENRLSEASAIHLARLSDLKVLKLDRNRFGSIPAGLFKGLDSLQNLNLAYNGLHELTDEFLSLEGLTALDLSSNKLLSLADSAFDPLVNLTTLMLSNNEDLPGGNLSFAENIRLITLSLSGCGLQAVPKIGGLARLTSLDLSQNSIQELSADDKGQFSSLSSILSLDLSGNRIRDISSGMFDGNLALNKVVLKNNKITNIAGVFENSRMDTLILSNNLLTYFSFDYVSPYLLVLDLRYNSISEIVGPTNVRDLKISSLYLSSNRISVLDGFKIPGSVQMLDLEGNNMSRISFNKYHPNQSALIPAQTANINLRNNNFLYVCLSILYVKYHQVAPVFDVRGNGLTCACERMFQHPKLVMDTTKPSTCASQMPWSVNLFGDSGRFLCDSQSLACQCNLEEGYSEKCGLPCPGNCSCHVDGQFSQYFIDCRNRSLTLIPDVMNTALATNVSFSHNDIRTMSRSDLGPLSNAIGLYLDHNLLEVIGKDTFLDLAELLELDLGHNRLSFLDPKLFLPLTALQELRLDSNFLTEFPVWKLSSQNSSLLLALSGNPWSCNCSYVEPFRRWLQDAVGRVSDAEALSCELTNGTRANVPMIFFNSSYCYRGGSRVITLTDVTLMVSLLAGLLLLVTVVVLAFIYRREVQVLLYSRYGVRLFSAAKDGDEDMTFDAFVAYSGDDEEFVCCNLVPKLEDIENPYKLCVHHRDFVVGEYITENIHQAVNSSRRTIVVLSDSFVASDWCHLEFEAAYNKMITDRCNRLIVIVLGELTQELGFDMKLYMKTKTYVKWGDPLFWEKLYFAMPDRKLAN